MKVISCTRCGSSTMEITDEETYCPLCLYHEFNERDQLQQADPSLQETAPLNDIVIFSGEFIESIPNPSLEE